MLLFKFAHTFKNIQTEFWI